LRARRPQNLCLFIFPRFVSYITIILIFTHNKNRTVCNILIIAKLKPSLALIYCKPAGRPNRPTRPAIRRSIKIGIFGKYNSRLAQNGRQPFLVNGRQPQFFSKKKTTSKFWQMEDDLKIMANGRRPQTNIYIIRRPQTFL
jgi:hypothetical protein